MFSKTQFVGLVGLGLLYVRGAIAAPQVTTTIPFMVGGGSDLSGPEVSGEDVLSGVIVGTGTGGETTYVVSAGGTASDDPAVTATLIAGASGATAIVAFTDEDGGSTAIATQTVACGIQDGNADCTMAIEGIFDSVTTSILETTSGPADFVTLVFSTSSPTAGRDGASATGTSAAADSNQSSSTAGKNAVAGTFVAAFSLLLAAVSLA